MEDGFFLIRPKFIPPLDAGFRPAVLANRAFEQAVTGVGVPLVLGLEREAGKRVRWETRVFPEGHPHAGLNFPYVERLVKFLLWQRGGFRLFVGGPASLGEHLRRAYRPGGERAFDAAFMGEQVYEHPFEVLLCQPDEVPDTYEPGEALGRHLDGCRIGFDLGASDRKVSALVDGDVVYAEEVIWAPRQQSDPAYHYNEIMAALRTAAAHLPRLDAIGGSSAGIYLHNRPMVASLFRGIPPERYGEIRDLFLRIRRELGVPLVVINDGDVAALAGSMSLEEGSVLGIALGSSQAAGYIDPSGQILGWLSELAFAPVDYNSAGAGRRVVGRYWLRVAVFLPAGVFRLAPQAGIAIPAGLTDADKLAFVQERLEAGHPGAAQIWESMGIYLGYALAHYADFYDIRHVLLLGRCTSGRGGTLLLARAQAVLRNGVPRSGWAAARPAARRAQPPGRPGHRGRQPAGVTRKTGITMRFHQETADWIRTLEERLAT